MDTICYYVKEGDNWALKVGTVEEFVNQYEKLYFLSNRTYENDFIKEGTKTNPFVEDIAFELLKNGIDCRETLNKIHKIRFVERFSNKEIHFKNSIKGKKAKVVFFIIAWKIGCIRHTECKYNEFIFNHKSRFDEEKNEYVVSALRTITFDQKYVDLVFDLASNDGVDFATAVSQLKCIHNVSYVYAISELFFISKANYPIYDRFAAAALYALKQTTVPDCTTTPTPKEFQSIKDKNVLQCYSDYSSLFDKMVAKADNSLETKRKIDRALWVYGHLFNAPN